MSLKDNIKAKRQEQKMTLEELANKIGTTRQTIQKYESGVISNIPLDKIEKLAEALDCSPAYLMGWEETSKTPKLDEYRGKNKILFSKYEKLKDEDKAIIEQMIERFERETQD